MASSPFASFPVDFSAFAMRAGMAREAKPTDVAQAGLNLVDGAMRIRRGGDGLYGDVERPFTKQVEAVGVWLNTLERDAANSDRPFRRSAEMREALVAAAEEVDRAATVLPAAGRLRNALYTDALDVLGVQDEQPTRALPWIIASALGGILIGVLLSLRGGKRR